ncbi:MAG: hypothetical protein ACI8WB_004648 [Phenylobacterium sp.]|jgi:hypothetical protein
MKNTIIKSILSLALGCSVAASAHEGTDHGQAEAKKSMIECQISAPGKVKLGQEIPMDFTLTNTSGKSLEVLRWNTPLEGWFNRYLTITRDGQRVNYQGPMVKRFRPSQEDYSTLSAGQSTQATVNLAQGYDMAAIGTYKIVYSGRLHDLKVAGKEGVKGPTLYSLQCNGLTVVVE